MENELSTEGEVLAMQFFIDVLKDMPVFNYRFVLNSKDEPAAIIQCSECRFRESLSELQGIESHDINSLVGRLRRTALFHLAGLNWISAKLIRDTNGLPVDLRLELTELGYRSIDRWGSISFFRSWLQTKGPKTSDSLLPISEAELYGII